MKKIFLLTCLFVSTVSYSQSDDNKDVYNGYLTSDLQLLKKHIDGHNYEKILKSSDISLLLSELESYYVLLSATLTHEDEVTFTKYVDRHVELAERIISLDQENARAHAMLSGIYGLKIAYSPIKGMFLGPKSNSHSSKSMKSNSEDPLVLLMYGINKYNTPSTWGGDVNAAIDALNKVSKLYEDQQLTKENWKYLHALAWLGIAYEDKKEFEKAKAVYEKSINNEPEFDWGNYLLSVVGK